jgi:hypothetical protein
MRARVWPRPSKRASAGSGQDRRRGPGSSRRHTGRRHGQPVLRDRRHGNPACSGQPPARTRSKPPAAMGRPRAQSPPVGATKPGGTHESLQPFGLPTAAVVPVDKCCGAVARSRLRRCYWGVQDVAAGCPASSPWTRGSKQVQPAIRALQRRRPSDVLYPSALLGTPAGPGEISSDRTTCILGTIRAHRKRKRPEVRLRPVL